MASHRELALGVAAGLGIGVAATLVVSRLLRPSDKGEKVVVGKEGYMWCRPELVPRSIIEPKTPKHPSKVEEQATAAIKETTAPSASAEENSESSSHLAANHLSAWLDDPAKHTVWPPAQSTRKIPNPMGTLYPGMNFLKANEKIIGHIILNDSKASSRSSALRDGCIRANSTEYIWWSPNKVKAAMVTCGGLCPGLNSIIRGITNCLWQEYEVHDITGITAGYNGLSDPENYESIPLNPSFVREIHMKGGSILKAGRGGFDAPKIIANLRRLGINLLFVIGGDGTQFAGHLLYEEARKQRYEVSVVGVPKSIDNDVLFVDRTFGFDSAVEAAAQVIQNSYVEATSCAKGVGIVKLMGRDAGFVAANAALASNIVDLVLVPEVKIARLQDIFDYVDETLARKGHMVIVVGEGAMQDYVSTGKKDATGHTIYGDSGVFMRDTLNEYLKPKGGRTFYIDPSYIIRSVPVTPNDHIYCSRLANNAVHTAMRGYTGVCVGAIHNVVVILKSRLIASGKKQIKVKSSTWQTCVQLCRMPANLTGIKQESK